MEMTAFEDRLIESALAIQDAWEPEFHDTNNPTERIPIPAALLLALDDAVNDFVRDEPISRRAQNSQPQSRGAE